MKRKFNFSWFLLLSAFTLLLGLGACSREVENDWQNVSGAENKLAVGAGSASTASFSYVNAELSPERLKQTIDQIYETVEMKMIEEPDETIRTERFYLSDELFEECYIRYCANRYGLADLTVVKPAEDQREAVWQALERRLQDRRTEFENYDIHNSYAIAMAGEVFEIGDYLVMVIFEDNAPVKEALQGVILA